MLRRFRLYYLLLSILLCIGFAILSVKQYNVRDFTQLEKSAMAARNTLDYFFEDLMRKLRFLDKQSQTAHHCNSILLHLQAFTFIYPDISAIGTLFDNSYCVTIPGLVMGEPMPDKTISPPLTSPLISQPYHIFRYQLNARSYHVYLLSSLLSDRMEKTSPFIDEAVPIFKDPSLTSQTLDNKPAYKAKFPWIKWQQHYSLPSHSVKNLSITFLNNPELSYRDFWLYESLQLSLFGLFLIACYLPLNYYMRQRFSLQGSLKNALRRDQFFPVYQPMYDWQNQCCCAVEVLLRWQDNTKIVIPQEFIKVAEASGLIAPMTEKLIEKALDEMHPWLQAERKRHIAFNISRIHLLDTKLTVLLTELCEKYAIAPQQIMLELTERELIDGTDPDILEQLKEIREKGFLFAIDDFGTGHSSIHYLNHVPANYLKIDMMYTHAIGTDSITATLMDPIIHLAKELQLTIVAEGVETEAQAAYLKERKVDILQGWLYGKPMYADDFLKSR